MSRRRTGIQTDGYSFDTEKNARLPDALSHSRAISTSVTIRVLLLSVYMARCYDVAFN